MPDVLCDGYVRIIVIDPINDEVEVRVGIGAGHRVLMKRDKREGYDAFVGRVVAYCEKKYREGRGY